MSASTPISLFAVLMLLASSSVVTAVVTALFQRRNVDSGITKNKAEAAKADADAAKILSEMAIEQTRSMHDAVVQIRAALQAHREWDRRMVQTARAAGIVIEDPPELYFY